MEVKSIFIVSDKRALRASSAIAGLAIRSGFEVSLKCEDKENCDKASGIVKSDLDDRVAKGELGKEESAIALERFKPTVKLEDAGACDIAIESVFEQEDAKWKALAELDKACPAQTILITNTSTITITRLAGVTKRPQSVVGMHFTHFGPILRVAEIVRGTLTSEDAFNTANKLAQDMGLETVYPKDTPGLLSTRSWLLYINQSARCAYEGLGEAKNLKRLFQVMGARGALSPLESADFIGIDNCVAMLENLYKAYGDPKYFPCPLLTQMVDAGQLGISTGRGFFTY